MRKGSVEDGLRYASRKHGKIKLTAGDFGGSTASAGRTRSSRTPLDKRLMGWGEGVIARLHHAGVFANAEAVVDVDGCRLVVASDGCAHARVVLAVGGGGIDVRVELPDEPAFRGHMLRHARELFAALETLPEEFTIGTAKEEGTTARTSTLDEVTTLLDKPGLVRVGWRVPQDVALAHADDIDDQLEDALVVLAPIVKIAEGARDRRQEMLPQGVTNLDTKASIEKGARVQVMDGPFAGKVGTVQDLDGKGGARVMLGLLAAHLDVKDLSVTTSRRPVLGSSHRRPLSNKRG